MKKIKKIEKYSEVGERSNSNFCVCFFVHLSKVKEKDRGVTVGGWGLANPIFLFSDFFSTLEDP